MSIESDDEDLFDKEGISISNDEISTSISNVDNKKTSNQIDSLYDRLDIKINQLEKQVKTAGFKMQETYVVYLIESKPKDENNTYDDVSAVWRRYSEFELLRNYLIVNYPAIVMPPLPEKRTNFVWTKLSTDTFDTEFLERRKSGLEIFLRRISSHSTLSSDQILLKFLKQEQSWKDTVLASGYQAKSDSWLRTVNASWRVKKADQSIEDLRVYANELQKNISSVLQARAKLADRIYAIDKIHGNYERIFKEWGQLEEGDCADAMRGASTQIGKIAVSVDATMEEEEMYAEQLKEYLHFAESLKGVIKKHEYLQYDLETSENQLVAAKAEKKLIETGGPKGFSFGGVKAKLFGSDTPEQREQKLQNVEKKITHLELTTSEKNHIADSFLKEAKKEIELFKIKKSEDLQNILTNYILLQIKICKESRDVWQQFKECVSNI